MHLTWSGFRFELTSPPSQKEEAKTAGFHWDFKKRVWWTGLVDVAEKYKAYGDSSAKARFAQEETQISLSRAVSSNMIIPVPDGLSYLPFQKAGIEFGSQRKNTLIADEMGLGKTIQAIGIINAIPNIKNILLIPPASLRLNWRNELVKWLVRKTEGAFAFGNHFPDTPLVIINYDLVDKFRQKIDDRKWDIVIMDESHYLKNPDTKRTKSVLGYDHYGKTLRAPIDAGMRLFLTGTPILNRPVELWPMLRVADPEGLGVNHWNFLRKFCKAWEAPWGWDVSGADNLEELQLRLRSSIMIRRLKKDVLKELPPKRRQIIAIPGDKAKATIQQELDFYEKNLKVAEVLDKLEQTIDAALQNTETFQAAGSELTYELAVGKLTEANKVMFQEMSRLRHATAVAKIPYAIEYLENVLESQAKLFCFAHHHDVIGAIAKHFGDKAVQHHGKMSTVEKQYSVDRFRDDPNCRLFIGGITTAVGYSATAASVGIGIELDWRPAIVSQTEDRLHRIGQTSPEPVLIQHLVFDSSLDARMAKKIVEKQAIIDSALG